MNSFSENVKYKICMIVSQITINPENLGTNFSGISKFTRKNQR